MAKVTIENLNPIHTRTGRACIGWRAQDLAEASGLTGPNVRKFESGGAVSEKARQAMIDALTGAGVELLNGKRHGARLAKPAM